MEESGESSTEALGDRGSCSMHRRIRGKQTHHEDGQDIHSLSDERAKALLEYRARCTSARFWIQSELLDLRVGCKAPSTNSSGDTQVKSPSCPTDSDGDIKFTNPGVVGDLPSLMRRYLTCPLLSKLFQQDPVLSGKLATLDHVLWHRRSKHEPQTSGWMSHDAFCPDGCSFGAPGSSHGIPDTSSTTVAGGGRVNSNSSRSSTMDSMVGSEALPSAVASSAGASSEVHQSELAETPEDESRPVTVWVSCEQCMEHFAYITASLLVFLKPSELRDLAVERQQSNCCGFVFCGRRNVATPEKRRAALWRWTLDFGGSRSLTEDELVQFCCSRCCSRQQQLLRLLDEEPMYARPGTKEWISDALQRKAAYRPHPHGLLVEAVEKKTSSSVKREQGDCSIFDTASALDDDENLSRHVRRLGTPVEMDVLLREGPERHEGRRLMGPVLEKSPTSVSFSTESTSWDSARPAASSTEELRVPLTVDDESSADEKPPRCAKGQGGQVICTADVKDCLDSRSSTLSLDGQGREANSKFLMLDYNSSGRIPDANGLAPLKSSGPACEASLPAPANGTAAIAETHLSAKELRSPSTKSNGECRTTETQQPLQQNQRADASETGGKNCHVEPQIKSRSSRVRFADDDDEEAAEGDCAGDFSAASVFKHFFNMHDEDDGPGFYSRADRSAPGGTNTSGSNTRNGTGELRSILKPTTEPLDPSPAPASSSAEVQVGYMRLSDVVIAFDLLSSCCTDASAKFLADYHRRFCTCACDGAVPATAATSLQQGEGDESPKLLTVAGDAGARGICSRNGNEADESDNVSCLDGESGDEIEPSELWRRRQQQLLKAILRSLPPSGDSFAPLVTQLCETFQPLQPLPTLRCSLCSCLAAVLLLLLLLLRARPLTCCCCCESCRPWSNSHERHSRCLRRQSSGSVRGKSEGSEIPDASKSFYFDDALTLAREEDVGLALVDFVRSTIHQSAPCSSPIRPLCGGADASNAAEAAEAPAHRHEESAIHVLLESTFSRITRPIVQMCDTVRVSSATPQ